MRRKKLTAFLLAGITAVGAMVPAVPVMAETAGKTTVNLTIPEKEPEVQGEYTVTIPAKTTLDKDGNMVALENGLTVSGHDMKKTVVVSADSKNYWKLTSSEGSSIYYNLFTDQTGNERVTEWEFTADEVNANDGNGTQKDVYAKANAYNLENAQPGVYSDVITFSAKAVDKESGDDYSNYFWDGMEYGNPAMSINFEDVADGVTTNYSLYYVYPDKVFKLYSVFVGSREYREESGTKFTELKEKFKVDRQGKYLVLSYGDMTAKIDTDEEKYTVTGETTTHTMNVTYARGAGTSFSPEKISSSGGDSGTTKPAEEPYKKITADNIEELLKEDSMSSADIEYEDLDQAQEKAYELAEATGRYCNVIYKFEADDEGGMFRYRRSDYLGGRCTYDELLEDLGGIEDYYILK